MFILFYCSAALLATTSIKAGSSSLVFVTACILLHARVVCIRVVGIFDIMSLGFGVGGKGVGFHEFAGWVHVAMLRGEIVVGRIGVG